MKQFSVLLVILSFSLISCHKDSPQVPMYNCPVSQEAMDLAYFKPGTYWIYQDSATKKIDSTYVTSARDYSYTISGAYAQKLGYGGYFGQKACCQASSYLGLQWDYGTYFYPYTYQFQIDRRQNPKDDKTYIEDGGWGFTTPYQVNKPGTIMYSAILIDTILVVTDQAFFTLNGNVLSNVIEITHTQDVPYNSAVDLHKTKIFIRKNYGLLRKEVPDSNRVWNLIRCHIIQ